MKLNLTMHLGYLPNSNQEFKAEPIPGLESQFTTFTLANAGDLEIEVHYKGIEPAIIHNYLADGFNRLYQLIDEDPENTNSIISLFWQLFYLINFAKYLRPFQENFINSEYLETLKSYQEHWFWKDPENNDMELDFESHKVTINQISKDTFQFRF